MARCLEHHQPAEERNHQSHSHQCAEFLSCAERNVRVGALGVFRASASSSTREVRSVGLEKRVSIGRYSIGEGKATKDEGHLTTLHL
jgi:hypothetical protein